ncbi:hypothetical protein [Eisenbergiella sp.]
MEYDFGITKIKAIGAKITDVPITFGKTFSKTPIVFITILGDTMYKEYGGLTPFVKYGTVTQTSCVLSIANNNGAINTLEPELQWFAIVC